MLRRWTSDAKKKFELRRGNSSKAHDDSPFEHLDPNADCRGINIRKDVGNSSFQKERGEIEITPYPNPFILRHYLI
jgi:hypothetical protein